MKAVIVGALVALLSGCGLVGNDQAQISALQKQVATISQQVQAMKAQSAAVDALDLQSKCAIDAKRTFALLGYSYNKLTDGDFDSFASHYNLNARRCFMLITHTNLGSGTESQDLIDANEQMGYATLLLKNGVVWHCEVNLAPDKKPCTSQQQFDRYVAEYMGRMPQ